MMFLTNDFQDLFLWLLLLLLLLDDNDDDEFEDGGTSSSEAIHVMFIRVSSCPNNTCGHSHALQTAG